MLRKFCFCLALAVTASILVGCGSSSAPATNTDAQKKSMEEYNKKMQGGMGKPPEASGR